MASKFDSVLPELLKFSSADWQRWLTGLLGRRDYSPWTSIELDRASIELTELLDLLELKGRHEPFLEGVVAALEHTRPAELNAYMLLTLIELVGTSTPAGGKQVLMKLLRRGDLKYLRAANASLEVQALAAVSYYPVDEGVLEFVQDVARESRDFNLLGTCVRIASQSTLRPQTCRIFFPLLLRLCKIERDYFRVADEVKALAQLHAYFDFQHWLMTDFLMGPWTPVEVISFLTALDKQVVPFLYEGTGKRAEGLMLKIVTEAFRTDLMPETVVSGFRDLAGLEGLNIAAAVDFAISLFKVLRHARPEEKWFVEGVSKLQAFQLGGYLRSDLVYLWKETGIEDASAELMASEDGMALNLLSIGTASPSKWQAELKERFLLAANPRLAAGAA
jgi:hypothetical protein